MKAYAGLANRCNQDVNPATDKTYESGAENSAECLALLVRQSPELALVIERWEQLPEAVRAGIVAMVKAASAGE